MCMIDALVSHFTCVCRLFDSSNGGFRNWEFMTVHFWGEKAKGTWTLEIIDTPSKLRNPEVLGKA